MSFRHLSGQSSGTSGAAGHAILVSLPDCVYYDSSEETALPLSREVLASRRIEGFVEARQLVSRPAPPPAPPSAPPSVEKENGAPEGQPAAKKSKPEPLEPSDCEAALAVLRAADGRFNRANASAVDALYVRAYGHPHGRWSDDDASYASSQESSSSKSP